MWFKKKPRKLRIALDVDSVVINIHDYEPQQEGQSGGWLWRHNRDYGHEKVLSVDDLIEWRMEGVVAPSCGTDIYKYLSDPDFYQYAPPEEGALWGFQQLKEAGHEIWFVTSGIHQGKYDWLKRYGLSGIMDGGVKAKNIITIDEKALMAPIFDVLVDDRAETCLAWEENGGTALLYQKPWNVWCIDVTYTPDDWEGIVRIVNRISEGR